MATTSGDKSWPEVYSHLRQNALSVDRKEVGISQSLPDAPVWGVLMEIGYPLVTASLFALSDGTTSIYFSTGGGIIGGHTHEKVKEANSAFIRAANQFHQQMTPCQSFPLPETGRTVFYARTDAGVLTANGPEDDLGSSRHPLSALYFAGHAVITELRLIDESRDRKDRVNQAS
ncbi:MAG TPA: hypothetical protein VLQ90_06235 [Pyrinomonadaceae bacterium]|nr:hypothetical protein [Pyrinomonadaceae bacterium]